MSVANPEDEAFRARFGVSKQSREWQCHRVKVSYSAFHVLGIGPPFASRISLDRQPRRVEENRCDRQTIAR